MGVALGGTASAIAELLLMALRLVLFGLSLGLTVISFQAYRDQRTKRLESAFIGFAFLSMGAALATIRTQVGAFRLLFQLVETVPFIIGFGMLYRSLYR